VAGGFGGWGCGSRFVIKSNFLPIGGVCCRVQALPGVVESIRGRIWAAVPIKEGRRIDVRISTKLIAITLGSAVLVSGLVLSLVTELKTMSAGYTRIVEGPVQEAAAAQQARVDFNVQIQDWKDILLRGEDPTDLAKYTLQFHAQEAKVKAETAMLAGAAEDPATRQLLNDFLAEDNALSVRYQAAYDVYVKQHFDFKAADKLVRGQDSGVGDLFSEVLTRLNARIVGEAAAQRAKTIHQLMILLIVVGGILLVDSLLYCSVLIGVLKRLGQLKAVSDRLAVADIEGLSIDISGKDEIGAIGESLKGVKAAIHELLAVHAS
jgi:methyl-accepting chemotaxis protein